MFKAKFHNNKINIYKRQRSQKMYKKLIKHKQKFKIQQKKTTTKLNKIQILKQIIKLNKPNDNKFPSD